MTNSATGLKKVFMQWVLIIAQPLCNKTDIPPNISLVAAKLQSTLFRDPAVCLLSAVNTEPVSIIKKFSVIELTNQTNFSFSKYRDSKPISFIHISVKKGHSQLIVARSAQQKLTFLFLFFACFFASFSQ